MNNPKEALWIISQELSLLAVIRMSIGEIKAFLGENVK